MRILSFNNKFEFGQYKGTTVDWVVYYNPQYLLWVNEHVDTIKFAPSVIKAAKKRQEEQHSHNHPKYYEKDYDESDYDVSAYELGVDGWGD